ncbi:MAG TPA: hypothetical protein VMT38_04000 [Terracidiphilus sp.]|nr:hypothetical protein [Terracidiphilus sp.]
MNAFRRISLLLSLTLLAGAFGAKASAESFWAEHRVLSSKPPIRNACVMPAEAELDRFGVKSTERLPKESDDWAVALTSLVNAHLKAVGVIPVSATNPLSSGASDSDIQQVIQQIQLKYDGMARSVDKKPKEISKGAYTLGDQVAMLPCAPNSDVIVIIRGAGSIPTVGRQAMAGLAGGIMEQGALVTVTLVDAKSGEILAMTRFRNVADFVTNSEEGLGDPLDAGLADLNIGKARKLQAAREFSNPNQR